MGVVVRAYDPKLRREVALKLLRAGDLRATSRERLVREAQSMAQLRHPNVVSVYDVDVTDEQVVLVMELADGATLRSWLREADRPYPELLRAFVAAGQGLAAAHRAGMVHRDFKPGNVLVTEAGRVLRHRFWTRQAAGGAAVQRQPGRIAS